ncbi:hypothetical protein [Spirosoma linguale]|uniref:Uncharacterized protein n=1 Tax=Spirosoma linguale (strain ATCC 33905 / DSM 74 / LMG 10896 / Claus 1) TaxID=504472 RepID=D2QEB5_SPILD|nr:hypothetical protein Slin_0406 [Spirosoma linguale DSM 74]
MTANEYKWHVNLVKDRYQYLDLTFEQAKEIYLFEQDKDAYSGKYYFSTWEEWDYELAVFTEILNDDQLKKHKALLRETIDRYEQGLIDEDAEKTTDILYLQELLDFYETQFLPELFKNTLIGLGWLINEKGKIQYLKTEYKRFLSDKRRQTLTDHFRHYRTFKPNELKAALLRNKLFHMVPDYQQFKYQMDEPTKAVVHYLMTNITYIPEDIKQLLQKKYDELKTFSSTLFRKYYGERSSGWHITIPPLSEEAEKEDRLMTLLLLDEKRYNS